MDALIITIDGQVWRYPGPGGWHFLSASLEDSEKLKAEKRIKRTGYGYVPVTATLGASTWRTTLFPSAEGPYLLAIKSSVRAENGVREGDRLTARCVINLSASERDLMF